MGKSKTLKFKKNLGWLLASLYANFLSEYSHGRKTSERSHLFSMLAIKTFADRNDISLGLHKRCFLPLLKIIPTGINNLKFIQDPKVSDPEQLIDIANQIKNLKNLQRRLRRLKKKVEAN